VRVASRRAGRGAVDVVSITGDNEAGHEQRDNVVIYTSFFPAPPRGRYKTRLCSAEAPAD